MRANREYEGSGEVDREKLLILVKHSLPEIEPGRPASHWRLSGEGKRRCQALADLLAAYQPVSIVSSQEPKAVETARIVAGRLGLRAKSAAGLHEHERRTAPFTDQPTFEAAVARFFAHPNQLVFGEESAEQAQARFSAAVDSLLAQHTGGNLTLVAHGTVITLFVARSNGIEPLAFWKRLGLPSLVVLSISNLALLDVVERAY
ncbi:MAG: histidine phosphatase family protein [Anaerolineales bacterium]|nr:histidine phosphatase family protein [Anaerolineales bacterium]